MEKIEKYQLLLSFTIISIVILLSSLIFASKCPKMITLLLQVLHQK